MTLRPIHDDVVQPWEDKGFPRVGSWSHGQLGRSDDLILDVQTLFNLS